MFLPRDPALFITGAPTVRVLSAAKNSIHGRGTFAMFPRSCTELNSDSNAKTRHVRAEIGVRPKNLHSKVSTAFTVLASRSLFIGVAVPRLRDGESPARSSLFDGSRPDPFRCQHGSIHGTERGRTSAGSWQNDGCRRGTGVDWSCHNTANTNTLDTNVRRNVGMLVCFSFWCRGSRWRKWFVSGSFAWRADAAWCRRKMVQPAAQRTVRRKAPPTRVDDNFSWCWMGIVCSADC